MLTMFRSLPCTRGTFSVCDGDSLGDGEKVTACSFQYFEGSFDGDTFDNILGEYSFVIPGSG